MLGSRIFLFSTRPLELTLTSNTSQKGNEDTTTKARNYKEVRCSVFPKSLAGGCFLAFDFGPVKSRSEEPVEPSWIP